MKQLGPLARASLLGLFTALALPACSGGGSDGGGRMFVLSCVLGCNNGAGGQDVTCGIVNTYVNQDIAFQFSEPVDLAHVIANPTSFRVIDESTAATPPGRFLLDPADKKRLIWRPALTFGQSGAPSFSFEDGGVYQIEIAGTATGSAGPFVQSLDGKRNESRVRCTINTTLGINDPIPGPPSVSMFVDEIDPISGGTVTKEIGQVTGQVSSSSLITLVFDDIMNLGTIVTPSTLTAPFITVNTDPDGNISDPSDQVPVAGTWSFDVNDDLLTTTAVFDATGGLPSGGSGQRKVVVNIPVQVVDLVGNAVANGGLKAFTPEIQIFSTVTIPPGGEQFVDQTGLDPRGSSADWGETTPGRLLAGQGGGSGRLGELVVGPNETVVFNTSPAHAELRVQFIDQISSGGSTLILGDPVAPTVFSFKANPPFGPLEIPRRNTFPAQALAEVATFLNNFVADPLVPEEAVIEQATYSVDGDFLVITWDTPGTVGNGAFFFDSLSAGGYYTPPLNPFTDGGVDSISFGGVGEIGEGQLLTNFDFQANPAGTPPPFTVDDGIFEFASVRIEGTGTLVFAGDNPARLYTRGLFDLEAQGLISAAGADAPSHVSNALLGQPGRVGGPGGGDGGNGADRPDNDKLVDPLDPASGQVANSLVNLELVQGAGWENSGIQNPGSSTIDGRPAEGVGGTPPSGVNPQAGAGRGGRRYPNTLPAQIHLSGTMEMVEDLVVLMVDCVCQMVAGPGSGGAYATDGGLGTPVAFTATALPDALGGATSNTPTPTAAGDSTQVGLPAPGVVPVGARDLNPNSGNLRGGAGGGGGGASVEETQTMAAVSPPTIKDDCITNPAMLPAPTPITMYRSHSGGAGGGGGGAVQMQVGREAIVSGVIDASGGDGASADDQTTVPGGARATPGGAGSGGAVLIQSRFVNMAPVPNRLVVTGGLGGTLFDPNLAMDLSTGGDGGVGLVRAESVIANPSFFDEVAGATDPFDNTVVDQMDPLNPNAAINWLSVDTWNAETALPGAFSAGQSCWYKPAGNFLSLDFQDDSQGFGWDMDLILDVGGGPQIVAYRNSTFFSGNSPQVHWGELFAENGMLGAPLVVRFQGAKSVSAIIDPCNIDPNAAGSPIDPNSLTQWVRHPEELNAFVPQPDMIRFLVLFDASHPEFGFVQGVTNLRVMADPN